MLKVPLNLKLLYDHWRHAFKVGILRLVWLGSGDSLGYNFDKRAITSRCILTLVERTSVHFLYHILVQFLYTLSTADCPLTSSRTVRLGAMKSSFRRYEISRQDFWINNVT